MSNIGIISKNFNILRSYDSFNDNTYIFYCIDKINENTIKNAINFLISSDCNKIFIADYDIAQCIKMYRNVYKKLCFIDNYNEIKSTSKKKIIIYNFSKDKLKNKEFINYEFINVYRKDVKPKNTIRRIKKILKNNNIKVKEKYIRRNLNGLYSIRLELGNTGVNGKGLSLKLAKASAYAELMERLQSNMLNKSRISTNKIDRRKKIYEPLLSGACDDYKKLFFDLDDIYFNVEKLLNIKNNQYEYVPINAVNCFCHTNGLASGNSFEEAVSQAIFEILERYCYQKLLNSKRKIKNIDVDKYPINRTNRKILDKLRKAGYKYYIKDCSLNSYPVLGFLLFNTDETKYTFTMAADYSFDIALSRCITEMLQGLTIKDLNEKLLETIDIDYLDSTYKYGFKSYNWLKCFNNNNGYLHKGFFCKEMQDVKKMRFKNYITTNKEILEQLKLDIKEDIYVKDYNVLGFDTYRVYIPYMTSVDCYDLGDLLVNKNYNKLRDIYTNIMNSSDEEMNLFINTFLELNKNIKYDELIKPSDLFHVNETSDYYRLDFTSLLIVLCMLVKRKDELCDLLEFKINNFNLSSIKNITYKIIIKIITDNKCYTDIIDIDIENGIREIINDPEAYLLSLDPSFVDTNNLLNKKSLV